MPAARRLHDFEAKVLLHEPHRARIDPVDRVDLSADEGVEPRRAVVDDRDSHAVEPAAVGLPVVPLALEADRYAGIESLNGHNAGADELAPVGISVRRHDEVI